MSVLYVSDLDGTLITSKECVSEYSVNVLNRLIANGMNFTFATTRSMLTSFAATKGLKLSIPIIVYNGALIVKPSGEVIEQVTFESDVKHYVLSVLSSIGIFPFAYSMQGGREKVSWLAGKETPSMNRYLSRRAGDERLTPVYDFASLEAGDVFYLNCMGSRESMFEANNIFSRDNRLICILHRETYQEDFWLEIMNRGATKAVAVEKVKNMLGCEKVVCFGDSTNDIPMFSVADEKYAVMNADEWLKSQATGVIGYCEEDGVAKWLDENSGFRQQ